MQQKSDDMKSRFMGGGGGGVRLYLHMGQLIIRQQFALGTPHGHVEAIAMRVRHDHIPALCHFNPVGEEDGSREIVADPLQQHTATVEDAHAVAEKVANVEGLADHQHIRRLLHHALQREVVQHLAFLRHDHARRRLIFDRNDLKKQHD